MLPIGITSVVEHLLHEPLLCNVPLPHVQAMAIVYLTYGSSNNNNYSVLNNGVHHAHQEAHIISAKYTWHGQFRDDYK